MTCYDYNDYDEIVDIVASDLEGEGYTESREFDRKVV